MKNVSTAVFAITFAAMVPTSALAFLSINRQNVNQVSNSPVVFEVVGRAGARTEDYWCAAGDYAQRSLGLPWRTRLYISRERGQSETTQRRSAVQFTTDPQALGITPDTRSVTITNLALGSERTVTHARGACEDVRIPANDR